MNYRTVILVLAVAVMILVGRRFTREPAARKPTPPAPDRPKTGPPLLVRVALPLQRTVTDGEEFTGRTEASQAASVWARVSGPLDKVYTQPGATVKQGDLLFEIDPKGHQQALDKAEKKCDRTEEKRKELTAAYEKARARWEKGDLKTKELDKARAAQAAAAQDAQAARTQRELARIDRQLARVTAPIGGTIGPQVAAVGTRVTADRTLLATIARLDPVYVYFDVDQATVLRVKQRLRKEAVDPGQPGGLPLLLGLADEDGYPHEGAIDLVGAGAPPATDRVLVRAAFANAEKAIAPGKTAWLRLPLGRPYKALLVNPAAVVREDAGNRLLVLGPGNAVEFRPVVLGQRDEGMQVVRSGLRPGEWVIISQLRRLERGEVVEPLKVTMPVAQPAPRREPNP